MLFISTGVTGSLKINNDDTESSSLTVNLNIFYSGDAVNMKFSEDINFLNVAWTPVENLKSHTFDSEGSKTVYIQFADANGLESGVFSSDITIDASGPTFNVEYAYTIREENMTISLTNVSDSSSVTQMKIASSDGFDSAQWENYSDSKEMPYAKNIKIQLKDDMGFESEVVSKNIKYTVKLSQARSQLASTTVGDLAIFAGGFYRDENISSLPISSETVDIYNSNTNSWIATSLSEARHSLVAINVGNLAIFAGGENDSEISDVVDIYDLDSDSWSISTLSEVENTLIEKVGNNVWTTPSLSQSRSSLTAITIGTKTIFAGGDSDSNVMNILDTIDIFDSETGRDEIFSSL